MTERVRSLVFASLDETSTGDYAHKLPLHITVIPPFEHDRHQTITIENAIDQQLKSVEPFNIVGHEEDQFGSNRVRLVGGEALRSVHLQLLPLIQGFDSVDIAMEFAGNNYNPHSMFIGNRGLDVGEERKITSLYLGQRQQLTETEGLWHVAEEFRLGRS